MIIIYYITADAAAAAAAATATTTAAALLCFAVNDGSMALGLNARAAGSNTES